MPAVIVGICNDDKILVTKYRTGFAHYALVAGFTEIGETLEETVQREVLEETGLRVKTSVIINRSHGESLMISLLVSIVMWMETLIFIWMNLN